MIPGLEALLHGHVEAGSFPGAQCVVLVEGRVVHRSCHGVAELHGPAVTPSTRFDLASVSKAMATTALALRAVGAGALRLDRPVVELLPRLAGGGREAITVRHLLDHTTGLPAWRPLFLGQACARAFSTGAPEAFAASRAELYDELFATPLQRTPGERRLYSDLGFLLLGLVLEATLGAPLHELYTREIAAPLGLRESGFCDLAVERPALPFAVTGGTRPREPAPGQEGLFPVPEQPWRATPGEVDDDHAFACGGVAGHAGLFGTAADVARFGAALLEEAHGAGRLAPAAVVREFLAPTEAPEGPRRALGLDVPAPVGSSAGALLGRGPEGGFGHLGFTGCSLWVDRDRRASIALTTNRVRHGRGNVPGITAARPAVHDLVCRHLDGGSPA